MSGRMSIRPATIADAPRWPPCTSPRSARVSSRRSATAFSIISTGGWCARPSSFAFVAADGDAVVGFAAGTENLRELYRSFLLHDGVAAWWQPVLGSRGRGGGCWRRCATRPTKAAICRPPSSSPSQSGPRRGSRCSARELVDAVTAEFTRRGVTAARVVAGADNEAALGLYRACGFRTAATLQVHRGTASEVLTWS